MGDSVGRIALYLTEQQPLLAPPVARDESEADPVGDTIRALLAQRGALRFDEIVAATQGFPNDLQSTLWRLVWQGEVTNDTLAPLRSMLKGGDEKNKSHASRNRRHRSASPRFRSRRRDRLPGSEGRWSLISRVNAPTPTERQAALATQLLERYGVFTRSMATRELAAGGFAALYPVLKAMEEAGRARRGYFVEGLGGAQFAWGGADDLLRTSPTDGPAATLVLAATDPANAYGAALPWPATKNEDAESDSNRPQRAAGALVVLADGKLLGYVGKTGTKLTTFLSADEPDRTQQKKQLIAALVERAKARDSVLLEQIDGVAPAQSPLGAALLTAGFVAISRGYVHRGAR